MLIFFLILSLGTMQHLGWKNGLVSCAEFTTVTVWRLFIIYKVSYTVLFLTKLAVSLCSKTSNY